MRLALMLGQREDRCVPAVGVQARGGVDRQAEIIANLGSRDAFRLIFVEARRPLAGEIVAGRVRDLLRTRRKDRERDARGDDRYSEGEAFSLAAATLKGSPYISCVTRHFFS